MLVVSRFRVPPEEGEGFRVDVENTRALLAEQPGYVDGTVGRSLDDPALWALVTRWESVGAYRRALSSYDVKLGAVPVLSRAIDEPGAFEIVEPGTDLNTAAARSLG